MTELALIVDPAKRSFDLVTEPYFVSAQVVCANTINGVEISARCPNQVFLFDKGMTKLRFFEHIRESFTAPVLLTLRALDSYNDVPFSILNGVCTLTCPQSIRYVTQFTIEKGIRLTDDILLNYSVSTNSYQVFTRNAIRREQRYTKQVPRGESYDRVIHCLDNFGPMTTAEIARELDIPENRVSGRVSELRKCGMIRTVGSKNVRGRSQTLWSLTPKARRV